MNLFKKIVEKIQIVFESDKARNQRHDNIKKGISGGVTHDDLENKTAELLTKSGKELTSGSLEEMTKKAKEATGYHGYIDEKDIKNWEKGANVVEKTINKTQKNLRKGKIKNPEEITSEVLKKIGVNPTVKPNKSDISR